MNFREVRETLQLQHAAMSTIASAPLDVPRFLKPADLPAVLAWPGAFAAARDTMTGQLTQVNYAGAYSIALDIYVEELREGHSAAAVEKAEAIMDELLHLYRKMAADPGATLRAMGVDVAFNESNPFEIQPFSEMVLYPGSPTYSGLSATIRLGAGYDAT